jgi:hypothetical protein
MRPDERSRDIFEEVPGYEKAPLPPLPSADDFASLARWGLLRLTPTSRRILRTALRAIGYQAFHDTLPERLEGMLRSTNTREWHFFATPVFSATEALADDPRISNALERAATLVIAAHSLCQDVMSGRLEADTHRGQPLEMGQYPNLFSTIALVDDRARLYKGKRFDLVGVLVRRRIYILDLSAEGELTVPSVAKALAIAVAHSEAAPALPDDAAPGILSATNTRTLTSALRAMEASEPNASSIAALRECFVVLCLDLDSSPASSAEAARLTHAANPANRWYLSSFQLVVFGNAKAGLILSFMAYLDGNVQTRSAAELWRRAARQPLDPSGAGPEGTGRLIPPPRALDWKVSRRLARRAWRQVRRVQDDQVATFVISGVGRKQFNAAHVEPVGAFVLALALATKRRAGRVPAVLQLLTISKYRCVPVGAAIVTTAPEAGAFFACLEDERDRSKARSLLGAAIESQARECRSSRDRLALSLPIEMFIRTRRGPRRAFTFGVLVAAALALKATGSVGLKQDVIISYPTIYPEIDVVGRPGVRLPYVNHFGLHYQIHENEILLTFMPGLKWRTANAVFVPELERAIHEILEIAQA